ncbi:hypothetical protein NP493_1308g00010 [Ridgeia piscesae]|uniref:G-protein coupled receptors family 1 profile domain-containing protein n=1 Tax=Ridgeia piscesae TaxID=27915 RepID=A0AAD9K864_RIDPI|nr:hypothetical protein NP493_1308g00010 [Ridgeia piscesae]
MRHKKRNHGVVRGHRYARQWWFGGFLCKAIPYLQAVAVSASVNTLAAVAVERYLAICYAHLTVVTPQRALAIIGVLWFVPCCLQLPWAIYMSEGHFVDYANREKLTICYTNFSSRSSERGFFLGIMFLTCYLIPLCFLALCYSLIGLRVWSRSVAGIRGSKAERNINRSKIRIVRMLVTVTVFFACSWLPLYCVRMRILFGPTLVGQARSVTKKIIIPMAQWLGSANSCMNPFIYCYFSEHFRRSIIAVLRSRSCCSKISGDALVEQPTGTTR